ncbi:DivIVA domain-containing protein [Kytococcus sedentarius]|uniref:DivIVA domain-containing protein n=1 Tax=Kytococcus sedentarius TaxID=1276 RepID=UPI0035BC157E
MPLNPDDLFEHEFDETRLRPGYDKSQVNDFLDGVQAELRRLIAENESLRDRLHGHSEAPEFAGGWEGPVEPITHGGPGAGSMAQAPADDGFVPAGGPAAPAGSAEHARQEADQRIMAAMHAAESAEFDAHHRIEEARREQAEAEAALERVKERVAGLTVAADRVESAGSEGAEAGELLAAAQRLHDEHVWAAEESARAREEHVERRLTELERRITDARERLAEADAMLRVRADEFAAWAAEQRRFLAAPSRGRTGASSLWG